MAEKPIIICTELIPATMDGRKTVTRRINKLQEINKNPNSWIYEGFLKTPSKTIYEFYCRKLKKELKIEAPYQKGDILWVKEVYREVTLNDGYMGVQYKADDALYYGLTPYGDNGEITKLGEKCDCGLLVGGKWKSSRFMPKWAARIWLEVLDVRPERLQEINEVDIWKEGLDKNKYEEWFDDVQNIAPAESHIQTVYEFFADLWDSLNAKRGYSWESNPWVWRIEFELEEYFKQGS